eukprot:scaffold20418_cov112-Isochrysis_galbana.AAC.5
MWAGGSFIRLSPTRAVSQCAQREGRAKCPHLSPPLCGPDLVCMGCEPVKSTDDGRRKGVRLARPGRSTQHTK